MSYNLRQNRSMFIRASAPGAAPCSSMFELTLRSTHHGVGKVSSGVSSEQRFLIAQSRAGGKAAELAASAAEVFAVPLIPW